MSFFVYILRCLDYSYYTRHTDDLEKRLAQHHAGEIAGYTQNRRPVRLVFADAFRTRIEALEAERRLKGSSGAKKEALIMQNWERVRLLARNYTENGRPTKPPSTRLRTGFDKLRANGNQTPTKTKELK